MYRIQKRRKQDLCIYRCACTKQDVETYVLQYIDRADFVHLVSLTASDFRYGIPQNIFLFSNLKRLHLNDDEIRVIPERLWDLDMLEYLDLSHNPFSMLPIGISKLKRLSYLNTNETGLPVRLQHLRDISQKELISMDGHIIGLHRCLQSTLCLIWLRHYCPFLLRNDKNVTLKIAKLLYDTKWDVCWIKKVK